MHDLTRSFQLELDADRQARILAELSPFVAPASVEILKPQNL